MIINIYKKGDPKPQQYTFKSVASQVLIGRNPKSEDDN